MEMKYGIFDEDTMTGVHDVYGKLFSKVHYANDDYIKKLADRYYAGDLNVARDQSAFIRFHFEKSPGFFESRYGIDEYNVGGYFRRDPDIVVCHYL